MDKLQPILAQKYWIVFVAAMIMPTVGWWIAAGNVQGETEEATSAANGAFDSVPPNSSPNASYGQAVETVNETLEKNNKEYNKYLWDTQRAVQVWPASINDEMQQVTYNGAINIDIRRIYRLEYFDQLKDIPKIVEAPSVADPSGKVLFDLSTFTPQITESDWGTSPPDSKTMWEVQEDLWLLSALLGAVADTNRGYDNILQAPVKEITLIELRGGSAKSATGGESIGTTAEPGGEAGTAMPAMLGGGGSAKQSGGMGGQRGGGASFDPTDVFGSDADKSSSAAAGPGAKAAGPAGPGDAFAAGGFAGSGGKGNAKRRYIDDEEGAPFKTRGFYMEVIMDHSKLPDLMVHLSSLDWPVEIVRVQQTIQNPDQFAAVAGGNSNAGGRGAGRRNMQGGGGRRQFGAPGGRRPAGGRNPMGNIGPMGPMGPMGAGNRGGVQQDKAADFSRMLSAAMQKTSLVQVAIAGKLTMFQPPAVDESAIAGNDPTGATATDPATTVPPTGDAASADGVGTNPEAETTEEPAVPGTSPDNTPANGAPVGTPPAGTPPTDATPLPNTNEKAAPTPETTPASAAAKPATTQPEQKQPE